MANVLTASKVFATATLNTGTASVSAVSSVAQTLEAYASDYHEQTVQSLAVDRMERLSKRINERALSIAHSNLAIQKELQGNSELKAEYLRIRSKLTEVTAIAAE